MPDPRFHPTPVPATLADLLRITTTEFVGDANTDALIYDVAPLHTATPQQLGFFDNIKYLDAFKASQAGFCIVRPEHASQAPAGMICLLTKDPLKAYALAAQHFYPSLPTVGAVHKRAVIHPTATIGSFTDIAAGAVIGAGVVIGQYCRIEANAVLGENISIGNHTVVGANSTLSHCLIGSHVVIYPGACIGQPGFGFAFDADKPVKIPQLGRVIIEDHVEIGANSTIDRGAGPDTVLRRGVMLDNQIQIAHNVELGRNVVVVAQAGIAGSTKVGDYTIIAGQAGLTGHLSIGKAARIAAGSGVMRDVADNGQVGGSPAVPLRDWLKQSALLTRMVRKSRTV